MPEYYIYLISSLPMLHFGAKTPFSSEEFIDKCRGLIPDNKINILKGILNFPAHPQDIAEPVLKKWREFETALRNEFVKVRAGRKKTDPLRYLREGVYPWPHFSRTAFNVYRNPSISEGEKILDKERWDFLDEIAKGHYFDFDFLIVYACKLSILEKWERIRKADKAKLLEGALREEENKG
ncbi:MAG: hypothetical protein COV72_03035 [Candidatus Omnitrophica bacterium CG11_big_fil_rev_8_21_14_0_20_42_13]|uniref:DUF2764 domain-containing protein n=1 Tax=Candidatus Ghiorseimicrobium undicola TaxID=1974746 RepID=A0A2H0LYI0_9BACT|nr:MAG: hypothetical protein COV72_03035 [Candidatus Omnitrophica bacterium CG11_big_fil_rev_8_21_14_0_20_42_13]